MTTDTLEARLRGALADPVDFDRLRERLAGLVAPDTSANATFTRDPQTKRTTAVDIAPLGEAPCMRLHPTYDRDGYLTAVLIEDLDA